MSTLKIILHNNKSQLIGDRILINEIRENPLFKIRTPGYFFMVKKGLAHGWDGYKRWITETGLIQTGLVPTLFKSLSDEGYDCEVIDKRDNFKEVADLTHIGDFELRPYQKEAVEAFLTNKSIMGLRWNRGILHEATNAGKNLIAAAIYASYSSKRNGLFLINNKVIYNQAVKEIGDILGHDVVGQVNAAKTDWKKFNICMVQTLANRIKSNPKIRADVSNNDIMIVDEGDEVIGRKDTRYILDHAHNSPVRLSLTGTTGIHKDKIKNKDEIAFFGEVIHRTTNKQLVDWGYSAVPHIKIFTGNTKVYQDNYQEEYHEAIIKSKERNKKVWKRVIKYAGKDKFPILVLFKYHEHAKYLMKYIPEELKDYRIAIAHGKIDSREFILEKFRKEKIDILLCSMIIRRGKNLPLMRVLINAAGGDSHANALQILGRGLRKVEGKKEEIYFEDFMDNGKFLKRHSRHRLLYYKKQGFPVKELFKNK